MGRHDAALWPPGPTTDGRPSRCAGIDRSLAAVPPPAFGRVGDDLRRMRGERTRARLIDSYLALVADGAAAPTARQVAGRAGVSVRLLFHHFGTLEGLVTAAAATQAARHRSLLAPVPSRGDVALRVAAVCRQRRLYFEELLPLYRSAASRVRPGTGRPVGLPDDRPLLRFQLLGTFGAELAGSHGPVRLEALESATGWEAWRSHRTTHSAAEAERLMAMTAVGLLR